MADAAAVAEVNQRVSDLDDYKNEFEIDVFFAEGSTVLGETAKRDLANLADIAKSLNGYIIKISGYAAHHKFSTAEDQKLSEERAGRVIVAPNADLRRISGDLAVGESTAADLKTGARWTVSSVCFPAGIVRGNLLEFCGPSEPKGIVNLVSVSASGARRTLSPLPNSLYPGGASLSPDGRYVTGMFTPGCGGGFAFVIPTRGGDARSLTGEKTWSLQAPQAIVLGWTRDDRVVAIVQPSSKLGDGPGRGVYLIDPRTLARTLVYPGQKAWAMWSPA